MAAPRSLEEILKEMLGDQVWTIAVLRKELERLEGEKAALQAPLVGAQEQKPGPS